MNELTKHRQTALHLAAQQDLPTICSVLLENAVDFAALDENGNNGSRQYALCPVPSALSSAPSLPHPRPQEGGFHSSRAVAGRALGWASALPWTIPGQLLVCMVTPEP